jgi:hypothetical protein
MLCRFHHSFPTVVARLDRAIQYAAASMLFSAVAEYWITRFRG